MARKKRARRKTSNVKKKKKNIRQTEVTRTQNRALIAILALLLLLHLIDEKTFDSVTSTVKPKSHSKKKRGKSYRRVARKRTRQSSRKSQHSGTLKWAFMSSTVCRCGSGKRPLGFCNECGMNYCSECQFTHLYQPPPMKTSDSIASNLENPR